MSSDATNIKEIFLAAAELPIAHRASYLDNVLGDQPDLRQRVEALLNFHDVPGDFTGVYAPTLGGSGAAPEIGTHIGQYRLLEQIGEGGFGVVYLAEQAEPVRRKVALKILKPGMDTRQIVARFEAERQALAIMDHSNIAKVFDGGATGSGRPYFVMELVKGVPITEYCDENLLTPRQRLELFIPICQAVQHAHQKGIIHRDLKPSNVLVSRHDTTPTVKVIDFGVAKALGHELTDKTLFTGIAQMIGTPSYMSPEQAGMSDWDIDTRSDIYSLGVLLYELLTGTTPFTKQRFKTAAYDEIRRIIREEEPPKPSTRLSDSEDSLPSISAQRHMEPAKLTRMLRGELDWIVMKALEKDRNRRYETANGFALDVQRYLADQPVSAGPPSVSYRLRKFAARNMSTLVTAGSILLLLFLLGAAAGSYLNDRATRLAVTASNVEQAVVAAENLCRKGRLPEAVFTARAGQALLDSGGGSNQLRQRVSTLLSDLELAGRLEEARLDVARHIDSTYDERNTLVAYESAFRDFGFDVEKGDPADIADRIRQRSIQEYLTQALDRWASNRKVHPDSKIRLDTILANVDTDLWRQQVRGARADPKSLKQLAAAPETNSQPPSSLCLLGEYLQRQREFEAAANLLIEAQRRHADDFWVNHDLGLAMMYGQPARWDEAIRYFSVAVALRSTSPGARVKLGWALERSLRFDEAIATYREAIQLKPDNVQARYYLGSLLANTKQDFDGAIVQFSKVLEVFPNDVNSLISRASAYTNLRRYAESLADGDAAIKINPNRPDAWLRRAETQRTLGQRDQAIADYTQAIKVKPDYVFARNRRRELYVDPQENEKAIADASKILEASPRDLAMLRFRGSVYAESGRFQEAAVDYAMVVELEPMQTFYRYSHAMACLAAGDRKAYSDLCTAMLKRFANTVDLDSARWVVLTCIAEPKAVNDREQLIRLAEFASSKDRSVFIGLLGAAYFRAGKPERAQECFSERWRNPLRAKDWLFWALAHHQLGHADAARNCLKSADEWLAIVGPPGVTEPGKPIPRWMNWQEEFETRLLRREAEALLKLNAHESHEGKTMN